MKQTRYRALVVYSRLRFDEADCMLRRMAKANPKTIQELEAQKKAIREAASAEIEAIRKATAAKVAALKSRKRRDNHAKILVGVAMIHQCQTSEASAAKFKGMLEEFYSDSPERLKASLFGLGLRVTKPSSDLEQD
jgi:hypothetical protein